MDVHENARTTRHSRMLIIKRLNSGWSVSAVARAIGVTAKTLRKWRDRFAAHGSTGLLDRSSRPSRSPRRLDKAAEAEIEALRRQRLTSPAIARRVRRPLSTVGAVLRRRGLGRLATLQPRLPARRYERERVGELIHIDIKKLGRIDGVGHRITGDRRGQSNRRAAGRGLGWEYLHVAVDDRSRLAYTQVLASERKEDAIASPEQSRLVQGPRRDGRARHDRQRLSLQKPRLRCRPARSRRRAPTNPLLHTQNKRQGRALHPKQHSRVGYAHSFRTSAERQNAMHPWLHDYNTVRPHAALGGKPPISRLPRDNVPGSDI